jgi:glutathione S-transferase
VDHDPADGGGPLSVFESGAILQYLAEKTGRFQPADARGRAAVNEWLHWQMGGLGPMSGQCYHFHVYAPEPVPYAKTRYLTEVRRLYGVMERRLSTVDHLAGDYSIADMAAYPWMVGAAAVGIDALFAEVHETPDAALSDGPNSLTFELLHRMLFEVTAIREALGQFVHMRVSLRRHHLRQGGAEGCKLQRVGR